uniref:GLOBIN domain-containing protein n=1 Tax=Elaeophora elaphi TaxID=1147741 RepID=A0A0R3RLX9_9BILA
MYVESKRHANDDLSEICSEELKRLSAKQRCIIQETFKYLYNDCDKNGHKIFILLFSDFPEYKQIWPQFRGIPDSSIITACAVKNHGSVYMAGLRTIIDSMQDEEKLVETISKITAAHLKWRIYKYHIMNMLKEVIVTLQSYPPCQGKEVEDAWFILFDVIGNLVDKFSK